MPNLKVHCPVCGADFELSDDEDASPLRLARLAKGLSVAAAAEHVGMSNWALSRLERGSGNPKLSVLKQIASFYGQSIETLFPEPLVEDVEDEPSAGIRPVVTEDESSEDIGSVTREYLLDSVVVEDDEDVSTEDEDKEDKTVLLFDRIEDE